MNSNPLNDFLSSGKVPPSHGERSKLLTQLRHNLLTNQTEKTNMIAEKYALEKAKLDLASVKLTHAEDLKELARLTGRSVAQIQSDPKIAQQSKPTPQKASAGLTTAADYQKSIAPPTMTRSEFHKLAPSERARWIHEGGKLASDPEPSKPLSKDGQLTREGLRKLSPKEQNSYFAKGGRLAE